VTQYPPFAPPAPGQLDSILDDVDRSESRNTFLDRLPVGNHTVLFDRYAGANTRNVGIKIEADFVIEHSDILAAGERRGWAWFPNVSGDSAVYEKDRIKKFSACIDASLGKTIRTTAEVGRDLVNRPDGSPSAFRGLRLQVTVQQVRDKKTGQPKFRKNGEPMVEAFWSPVPGQNLETIVAGAAKMPTQMPQARPQQQQAPQMPPQFQGYAQPAPPASAYPHPGMAPGYAAQTQYPQGYPQPPQGYPNPYAAQPAAQPQQPVPPAGTFVAGLKGNGQ